MNASNPYSPREFEERHVDLLHKPTRSEVEKVKNDFENMSDETLE